MQPARGEVKAAAQLRGFQWKQPPAAPISWNGSVVGPLAGDYRGVVSGEKNMLTRPLLSAAVLAGALLTASAANAAPGVATGDVNMRSGPGTGYSVITTIPAGAPLEIYGCSSWCQVGYA